MGNELDRHLNIAVTSGAFLFEKVEDHARQLREQLLDAPRLSVHPCEIAGLDAPDPLLWIVGWVVSPDVV